MRRQIGWLTAATTSAVVLAFVIPLFLLVRTLAEDRAVALADQEARNVAILVSGLHGTPSLGRLVTALDDRSAAATTSVLTPDGQVLGAAHPGMADDPDVRRAVAGEAFTRVDGQGAVVLVPVIAEDGTSVVRTSVTETRLHSGVTRAWIGVLGLGLLLLAAAVLASHRLARRISTPVTDLAAVAHRLREGDLEARARVSGPTETVELGVALNLLAERIVELLAAERAVVGDLSHRLRTPVTALRLDVDAVPDPVLADRLRSHVGILQRTVDAIVKDARRPVRGTLGSTCDATAVVAERLSFWSALADDQGRRTTVDLPDGPCLVAVDAVDLRDVVDILVDNVFAHTPEGTAFRIRLSDVAAGARLTVEDEGPGFDEEAADAPPAREGTTGLGLDIVRRAGVGFHGDVEVHSRPGHGVRVEVLLPGVGGAEGA